MTNQQREQGFSSLIVIKECNMNFMVALTELAIEYAKGVGRPGFVQNDEQGFIEYILTPPGTREITENENTGDQSG